MEGKTLMFCHKIFELLLLGETEALKFIRRSLNWTPLLYRLLDTYHCNTKYECAFRKHVYETVGIVLKCVMY